MLVELRDLFITRVDHDKARSHRPRRDNDPRERIGQQNPTHSRSVLADIQGKPGEQNCWDLRRTPMANTRRQRGAHQSVPRQAVVAKNVVGARRLDPDERARHAAGFRPCGLLTEPDIQLGYTGIERPNIVTINVEVLAAERHESGARRVRGAIKRPGKRCVGFSGDIQAGQQIIEEVRRHQGL